MHTNLRPNLRPFATASIALVGATAIAMTPVAALTAPPDIKVANPAVQLSAAIDPITPWLEVFNNAEVNLANLADAWLTAPAPVLQQVIANQIGYLSQLPDFPAIIGQMATNLEAAVKAPFAIDLSTLESTNRLLSHRSLFTILQALGDESPIPAALQPLIDFSTTYTSGILLGLVGPVISPVLALAASVSAIAENLGGETPDFQAAVSTLINTPAAMADAFLNGGQSLDLTPVLDALGLDLDPGPGTDVTNVGITFGGLLSPGGSIFNALDFDITIANVIKVNIPGQGPGAIGSLIGLGQAVAKAIGWDGTGNPLAPPLKTPETSSAETPTAALAQANDIAPRASRTVTLDAPARSVTAADKVLAESASSGTTAALAAVKEAAAPVEQASSPVEAADESTGKEATATKASETSPQPKRRDLANRITSRIKSASERTGASSSKLRHAPKKSAAAKAGAGTRSGTGTAKSSGGKSDN
ncbi:outer membrane porin GjpA [Mycobacterium sp. DL440]|uniref:outer membrane porin GjpA n=1 Tax=Mycobacterium sp. DL440 TaxID=2675523 RepID=UPI001FB99E3D|nr:outer membrane porin GjpA [Mycobacterium sp. DL440]